MGARRRPTDSSTGGGDKQAPLARVCVRVWLHSPGAAAKTFSCSPCLRPAMYFKRMLSLKLGSMFPLQAGASPRHDGVARVKEQVAGAGQASEAVVAPPPLLVGALRPQARSRCSHPIDAMPLSGNANATPGVSRPAHSIGPRTLGTAPCARAPTIFPRTCGTPANSA